MKIRDIFRHSYAVGLAAEELAKGNHLMKDAPAFICGLLHDIGKMVLIHLLDHHYQNIIEISVDKNIPIEQVEKEILGFDHTDAGAWVLQKWGLPEIMTITAGYHHRLHEVNNLMPHLISLSDRMINHIEINCTERTVNNDSLPNIPENLELSDQDLYATALRICEHKMQIDALSLT